MARGAPMPQGLCSEVSCQDQGMGRRSSHAWGSGNVAGSGENGKDTVLRKRAGPWALACFVFKRKGWRQRDGETDLETQEETKRDSEQERRRRETPRD